jgi:hypothetical protein
VCLKVDKIKETKIYGKYICVLMVKYDVDKFIIFKIFLKIISQFSQKHICFCFSLGFPCKHMALAVNISGLCSRMFNTKIYGKYICVLMVIFSILVIFQLYHDMVKTGGKNHKQTEENTNK